MIECDGSEQTKLEGETRIELLNDLPWAEVSFVRVGASEIEIKLVQRSFGQEIGAAGEAFDFEELVFDRKWTTCCSSCGAVWNGWW